MRKSSLLFSFLSTLLIVAGVLALFATTARATDGYFPHGYGIVAKGMGGASTAVCTDGMAGAVNPAKMSFAGSSFEVGLDIFSPHRSASRTGNPYGLNGFAESDSTMFPVPEFGFTKQVSPKLTLGLTFYGNGGMNTDYPGGQIAANTCGAGMPAANLLCGVGSLGVDLTQMIVAPTVSYAITPHHAIGVSPLIGYQRFKAEGAQAFTQMSIAPDAVTNNDYDSSMGFGVRVGYFGQLSDEIAVGAAFAPRMGMGEFEKYRGLFAEEGDFDIPANVNVGVAVKPVAGLTLAADYQRLYYSDVNSVGNPSMSYSPLGDPDGPGFGWRDVNVYKVGGEFAARPGLLLRAGFNHADNPVRSPDVTINILAPGVIENHWTAGASFKAGATGWVHVSYAHAFENTVTGPTSPLFPGGGTDAISMYQNSFGIAYSKTFGK